MYNGIYFYYSIIWNIFYCLKILYTPTFLPSLLQPMTINDPFIIFTFLPFLDCHIFEIIQNVAFTDWFLSHSNLQFRFLLVFSWLDRAFSFLALTNIPLSGSIIVCLSVHLLFKSFSKVWQLWIKLPQTSVCRFGMDICFHLLWENIKEIQLLYIMVKVCLVW